MIGLIRKKKNESVLGKNRKEKTFLSYDSIQNILIIFNIDDLNNVCAAIDTLRKDNKNVSAWTTCAKNSPLPDGYPSYIRAIDLGKELTWTKTLEKSVIQEFEELNYDTFIDLTTTDDTILDYLLAANSSRFCVGIREHNFKTHDFIILKQDEHTIAETCEQLKYYLQRIVK